MRSTYATVSLANIKHNIEFMRSRLNPETKYLAVVVARISRPDVEYARPARQLSEFQSNFLACSEELEANEPRKLKAL